MKMLNKKEYLPITIGILGNDKGAGVTHLAIMTAGYLSSKERKKTAVIELNHDDAFCEVNNLYYGDLNTDNFNPVSFNINGVDYYCGIGIEQYSGILNLGYEYIVLDFGCNLDNNFSELMRCNIKYIVGSCSEWKLIKFESFISDLKQVTGQNKVDFLYNFGNAKLVTKIERAYHINIKRIPFEPTPFKLHTDSFAFLKQLCCL